MLVNKKVALIFFSRSAGIEAQHKRWLSSSVKAKNQLLADMLIARSGRAIASSPFDIFYFDEYNQRGDSFGDKIAYAFSKVFAKGYSAAVCVGNDTPELHKVDWSSVNDALQNGRNVLGPNHRNGAYLIGLTADSFDKGLFSSLRWQTDRIYQDLNDYSGDTLVLPQMADLNCWADVLAIFPLIRSFKRFVISLVQSPWQIRYCSILTCFRIDGIKLLRAPPSYYIKSLPVGMTGI